MRHSNSLLLFSLFALACSSEGAPPHGALDTSSGGSPPETEGSPMAGAGGISPEGQPPGQQCDKEGCVSCTPGFGPPEEGCPDQNECLDASLCEGGTCRNAIGSYYCDCPPGSEDTQGACQAHDACAVSPCQGTAVCEPTSGRAECQCPPGSVPVDNTCREKSACDEEPCGSDAECFETASGYQCACPSGTSGRTDCSARCETLNLDPALEAIVRERIGLPQEAGALQPKHVAGLTELDASLSEVTSAAGLECWVDLEQLDLSGTKLGSSSDEPAHVLTALAQLPRLRTLNLSCTHLQSLEPLREHPNLRELRINNASTDCPVALSDVSAIATLSQLERLDLEGHGLTSLPSLSRLTRLTSLKLSQNALSSLSFLQELQLLEELDVSQNQLQALSGATGLLSLKRFNLGGNEVSSLAPIALLASLIELRASDNQLNDIPDPRDWPRLKVLDLSLNEVDDLERVSNLPSVVDLNLVANQLSTLAPLVKAGFVGRVNALANPLTCDAEDASLELLAKQGAQVLSDCTP